jgi:hypothetical protein
VTTTTNDGTTVPYIVRVESGTINRGVYRLAVLDNPGKDSPATWKPGPGWNKKLVAYFDCCGSAQYNQGVHAIEDPCARFPALARLRLRELDRALEQPARQPAPAGRDADDAEGARHRGVRRGAPVDRRLRRLRRRDPAVPDRAALPGPARRHPAHRLVPRDADARSDGVPAAQQRLRQLDAATWTPTKQNAVNGFNANTCTVVGRRRSPASSSRTTRWAAASSNRPTSSNIFNRATKPGGIRCDLFQTNVNLLGKRPGTQEARRPIDNIGLQYGLAAVNSGAISVKEFLDLNEKVGGFDGDGNTQAARSEADPDALKLTYAGGFKNSFKGPGLSNIPIVTQRGNADAVGDIHDTMQDLIIRARLQRANGRSDNQIIWTLGATSGYDYMAGSLDLINKWLDNMAADAAPPSIDKVVRNKPAGANDACWDKTGTRIDEAASVDPAASCNVVYPRFSTPRLTAGSPLVNDVLKCQLKPVNPADYSVAIAGADLARLQTIFPSGVCDWSKPGVSQEPLRGTYLRLPLD